MPPAIPLGVPSDVLERRPDVASAERAMAAANAQIGVATAAFYPSIDAGADACGVDSRMIETLFDAPSLLWSLGVSATQPLFDGGRIRANVDFAQAGYEATVANYRRVVLTAMQEAEDGITGLAALDRAHDAGAGRRRPARAACWTWRPAATKAASSTYLDVITAQQALLNRRAPGRAAAGPAPADLGVPREGAGRRLVRRRIAQCEPSADARTVCPAPLRRVAGTR